MTRPPVATAARPSRSGRALLMGALLVLSVALLLLPLQPVMGAPAAKVCPWGTDRGIERS